MVEDVQFWFPAAGQGCVVERFDSVAHTIELPSQCITEGFDTHGQLLRDKDVGSRP